MADQWIEWTYHLLLPEPMEAIVLPLKRGKGDELEKWTLVKLSASSG